MGLSQFVQYGVFGCCFYAGARFIEVFGESSGDVFTAVFALIMGGFAAGQAQTFGPDMKKGQDAAVKIFKFIDGGSRIDPQVEYLPEPPKHTLNKATFQGTIEFIDVWFRYPARPNEWVFKGLNLKINNKESVALVGESGSGKSTFVGLLLRFYEPEIGEILIDGVPIKDYNI